MATHFQPLVPLTYREYHGWITVLRAESGAYTQRARFDRAATLASPEFPELSVPLAKIFAGIT
jgi:hypothetical protein